MPPYTLSWDADLGGLGQDGRELAALHAAVPGSTLFGTWEWLSAAASTLEPERALRVLCVRRNATLVACLPLTWGRERLHGLRVRSVRLLGDPLADRVTLLVAAGHEGLGEVVLDGLLAFPEPWDVVVLAELLEAPALRALVQRWAAARGVGIHWRHCARSPVLSLGHGDVGALRAGYARTLATRLRRSRKRLEAAGTVGFERRLATAEEVGPLLGAFKGIEDASWKGTRGVGIFSTPARERFFRTLSPALARRGWLDVGLLRLDGRLVSYRYGFRYRDVYLDYNLAYDPAFGWLSPGRILLDEMITSSLALGLRAVDASRASLRDGHQLGEWTDRYVDHHELWLFGRSPRGRLLAVLRTWLRPAVLWARARVRRAP